MKIDALEPAFIVQDLGECVDGSRISAVTGNERLYYEPGAD